MERIVVEVKGGVVQAIYGSKSRLQVVLVDRDNISQGGGAVEFPVTSAREMPLETGDALCNDGFDRVKFGAPKYHALAEFSREYPEIHEAGAS
jgi:hypothetical protein